jgi:hypothetical protein
MIASECKLRRKPRTKSKKLSPDRNFFDTITTTTTRLPRMGVGSLKYSKQPQQQQPNYTTQFFKNYKNASHERSDRYGNNRNTSTGSFMSDSRSSHNDSSDKCGLNLSSKTRESDNMSDGTEPEPEWFSFPASRTDFIDLHGFDEEDSSDLKRPFLSDGGERQQNGSMAFDNFANYGQRRESNGNAPHARFSNFNHQNRNSRAPMQSQNSPNMNRRYRHPNQARSELISSPDECSCSKSFLFTDPPMNQPGDNINPFFENWKLKDAQHEPANGYNWLAPGANVTTLAALESIIRQQNARPLANFPVPGGHPTGYQSVPQFFQNANFGLHSGNVQNPFFGNIAHQRPIQGPAQGFPTHEQLQEHTSQIMRNAIIRKQNHDEKNPK